MKKTDKNNDLQVEWEKRLNAEGLGLAPSFADALHPVNRVSEYKDEIETQPIPFNVTTVSPIDPGVITQLDPACDPRSGGIGGYGSKGLKKIRDAAGFRYNPTSFHAKIKHEGWDFVSVVSSAGVTVPRSIDTFEEVAFFTNIASAQAAGERERDITSRARRAQVPGWFKTDTSSGY